MIEYKTKSLLLILFLFSSYLFSQNSHFQTLQLEFSREEISSTGESAAMSGSIYYQSNPHVFVFKTSSPILQTALVNSDGTFIFENDAVYDYSEGESVLLQTCTDILTWFTQDCGLEQQGYMPVENSKEDGFLVTKWCYAKIGVHPFESILVYSDSKGRFCKLQMFTQDNKLFAETSLSSFKNYRGIYYPTEITTNTYSENKIFATTKLSFSNIKINKEISQEWNGSTLEVNNSTRIAALSKNEKQAISPQIEKFSSNVLIMGVNASYKFYKLFITKQDNSACPFEPSCSQYMVEAVSKYGPAGVIMGLERLKRCTSYEHSRNLYPVVNGKYHADPVN